MVQAGLGLRGQKSGVPGSWVMVAVGEGTPGCARAHAPVNSTLWKRDTAGERLDQGPQSAKARVGAPVARV